MADDRPDYLEDAPDVDWPEEGDSGVPDDLGPASEDDVELIGMSSSGTPVLHGAESSMLYHGEVNEDGRVTPRFDDEVDVDLGDDDEVRCRARSPRSASGSAGTR